MKKLRYIALLFPLILFSCISDDSMFGGRDIDEIEIEKLPQNIEVEIGTKLKVSPVITTKLGTKSDLSYLWVKYNAVQAEADTLSHEKDLDVLISDVLPGVITTLSLKVTDNTTGIFAMAQSTFTTIGRYSSGTLMLCRTGSEYDLSMLKKDGTTLYEDIYSLANNGEKLPHHSKRIFLVDGDARNITLFKAVVVTSHDSDGGLYINPVIFTRRNTMREKFFFSDDLPSTLEITSYTMSQSGDYLVVNGKLYRRPNINDNSDASQSEWYPPVVVLSATTTYYMAPYAAQFSGYPFYGVPYYYDNINGRMMYSSNGGSFSSIAGASHNFTHFDPNNLGKGVEMIMCGNRDSSPNKVWALMKDTGGNYFLITYQIQLNPDWTYTFISESRTSLSQSDNALLSAAAAFVPGTKQKVDTYMPWGIYTLGVSDMFFFVSNNKVYAFNVRTLSHGVLIDGATENYTITGIDCTQIPAPTEENPSASFNQLTLAIKDGRLGTKQGGVAIYQLSSIGGLVANKIYEKAGFCDEVAFTVEKID